ncbi:MAG: hypothetical protein Q4A32_07270 [Lachnospiraceae bacterium]|nr:hypothetical protein [Lachnospiraceae bacterium]
MKEKYSFTYRNTPQDFFWFYIGNVYSQWTAIVNVVVTGGMIALIFSRWNSSGGFFRCLMIFGLLLYPVFQPLALYMRGMKSAEQIEVETTLTFDDDGMGIIVVNHRQKIPWQGFSPVARRPHLTVISPDGTHIYLLPDRVTGEQKDEVLGYLQEKCGKGDN